MESQKHGLQYLKLLLIKYDVLKQELPTTDYITNKMDLEKETVEKYLAYLRRKGFISNERVVSAEIEKYISRKKALIPRNSPEIVLSELSPLTVAKSVQSKKQFEFSINSIVILKIVLSLIGVGAVYMSILYSVDWLCAFLSFPNAVLLGSIMVIYEVASFELIFLFWKRVPLLSVVFGVLWVVVTLFSMISTIAGQYNKKLDTDQKSYNQQNVEFQNKEEVFQWKEQKELYEENLKKLDSEFIRVQSLIGGFDLSKLEENRSLYNNLNWQFKIVKREREKARQEYNLHMHQRPKESMTANSANFYDWLGSIFVIPPDIFQFILSLFPAVFIDLVASFTFAVVMFYKPEDL